MVLAAAALWYGVCIAEVWYVFCSFGLVWDLQRVLEKFVAVGRLSQHLPIYFIFNLAALFCSLFFALLPYCTIIFPLFYHSTPIMLPSPSHSSATSIHRHTKRAATPIFFSNFILFHSSITFFVEISFLFLFFVVFFFICPLSSLSPFLP